MQHDSNYTVGCNCLNSGSLLAWYFKSEDINSVNFTLPLSSTADNKEACSNFPIVFREYIQWLLCFENQVPYHLSSFPVLIGGPLPRGHEFELHDVRFHWGRENQRGSEHTVNFKAFPMEVRVALHCSTMAKCKRFFFQNLSSW